MKQVAQFLFFLAAFSMSAQTIHNINDPEDLSDLSSILEAGDTVILADGVYATEERIKFSPTTGTSENPITFKAATPGGVQFSGGLRMSIGGDHVVVDGFHWKGGYGASNFIEFRDGSDYANYSKIQNCAIDGLEISPEDKADDGSTSITKHRWIVLYGTYNTVVNCSFMNKESAGALVLVELSYNASPDGNSCNIVGHSITNNYFYKYSKIDASLSNSGDSETIRIGASSNQNVNANVTVENNYFVEADGENEIITNKSKNNKFINNTFRRCRGSLVLRHGSHATVEGNYFLGENTEGTGGIRISDSNHTITNNYIQDCITASSQAKWNNGITFIGGGDTSAVACTATSMTNGYQKSNEITISNNSIVNTNAPLFFNTSKGSNDVTGLLSNNLIYFSDGNPNSTDVISGDATNAYTSMGTGLDYIGNVYSGADLGVSNTGFSEENEIIATPNGEVFTFSGTGSSDKGADLGTYTPLTDEMVGNEIGACFLNNLGDNILDGDCSVEIGETLNISNLPLLNSEAGSYDVYVTSNVGWTIVSNDSWVTVDTNSGTGNATIVVSITKNETTNTRTGTVTFAQNSGADTIVRTLTLYQEGLDLTDLYELINTGTDMDPVTIHSFSKEEVNGTTKFNYASNTLDKDMSSVWAADDGSVLTGDFKGDGEYIIYDLGDLYDLKLVQFGTTNKSDSFGFQVWLSETGTDPSNFAKALPVAEDLLLTDANSTDFNLYEITDGQKARYVKLIGFGRFNSSGSARESVWSAVSEIEFYGATSLSVEIPQIANTTVIYPLPAKDHLIVKNEKQGVSKIILYALNGKKIIEIDESTQFYNLDLSNLESGLYVITVKNNFGTVSRIIPISK
jgi:poly(beta-D-mannuronate) lyase